MQNIEIYTSNLDHRSKEAFKTLRTNIDFSGDDVKVICLTSCAPNEGKSSLSFELVTSYAQMGKKVLLIDADLRKSMMRQRHKRGRVRLGLSNYLVGKATFEETVCSTDVMNFYMIFSGPMPPNPSELLGKHRFFELINEAREQFDMVIIDTPPLGNVIDAAVISKACDGACIVISSGQISYRLARKVKNQLDIAGCKVLGVILNRVELKANSYYEKYYSEDTQ